MTKNIFKDWLEKGIVLVLRFRLGKKEKEELGIAYLKKELARRLKEKRHKDRDLGIMG